MVSGHCAASKSGADVAKKFSLEGGNPEMLRESWRTFGVISVFVDSSVAVNGVEYDTETCFQKSLEVFEKNEM